MAFVQADMGDGRYLVNLQDEQKMGQIIDIRSGEAFPPAKIGSIAAHGHSAYWTMYQPGQVDLDLLVRHVKTGQIAW